METQMAALVRASGVIAVKVIGRNCRQASTLDRVRPRRAAQAWRLERTAEGSGWATRRYIPSAPADEWRASGRFPHLPFR